MPNPLLTFTDLPPFSKIKPEHIQPAVEQMIQNCRTSIENALKNNTNPTWDNICAPLAESDDKLNKVWSPIGHMNSVANSPELREAYDACLPLLSDYSTWVGQHKPLYEAYKELNSSPFFIAL